jgi:hypothetical protein
VSNTFERSPEDRATYVKWCCGAFVTYGSIGIIAAALILAAHFSRLPIQFAGN